MKIKKQIKKEIYLSTGSVIEFIENSINKKIINKKTLYSIPLWSMKSKKKQSSNINKYKKIVVFEDHLKMEVYSRG